MARGFGSKEDLRAVAIGEAFNLICEINESSKTINELLNQFVESDYRLAVLEGQFSKDQSMWANVEKQLSSIGITWQN